MSDDIQTLLQSVKASVEENDGEIVYWGETIQALSPVAPALVKAVVANAPALKAAPAGSTKKDQLERLRTETIGDCHRCPLGDTRTKIVFGVGNPDARVMFVGEGPGFDEDRLGDPFVGKAGQLLDKIMAAIGLDRTKVYIANIVKCHPMVDPTQPDKRGNDRPPAPEEIAACFDFLKAQIAIVDPEMVVTLGATATKAVLGTQQGITALRGKIVPVPLSAGARPINVLPTYHPAALLRDENLKRPVWEDMKLLKKTLGL